MKKRALMLREPQHERGGAGNDRATHARAYRWLAAAIVLLAIVPYLNSLQGEFTFDDLGVIRDNPRINGPQAAAAPLLTTVHHPGALYRPLTMLTYLVNVRLGGAPWTFHVVNVVLHALVSLAAFSLAWRLLDSVLAAGIAGALFAVHPVHTEAVSSIVGRAEELAALLALTSLLAFARSLSSDTARPARWRAASIVAFALSLLAKESAFAVVALFPVVYIWTTRAWSFRQAGRLLMPFVLTNLGYLVLRWFLVGSLALPAPPAFLDNPLAHVPTAARLRTALVVLWHYVALLTAPIRLSADYSYNQIPVVTTWDDPRFIIAAALFTVLAGAVVLAGRRDPTLWIAVSFAAVPMALTANIFFPLGTIQAERLLYLPSLGWCLACGGLLGRWAGRPAATRGPLILIALLMIAYAGRTWARNRDWQDNCALFTAATVAAPESAKAHFNLAVCYQRQGRIELAAAEYGRAERIYPDYECPAYGIGYIYETRGVFDKALYWYERAAELEWNYTTAHVGLGSLHYRMGHFMTAEAAFRTALGLNPDNPPALIGLSLAVLAQGQRERAAILLQRVAALIGRRPEFGDLLTGARLAYQTADRLTVEQSLATVDIAIGEGGP